MNVGPDQRLNPQPFRDWCKARLAPTPDEWRDELGELAGKVTVEQLAEELGISTRRLYAWQYENKSLIRDLLEDALHRVDVALHELYDEEELATSAPAGPDRIGVFPGSTCKLTDAQLRILHRLHTERNLTVKTLAEQVWNQAGFASWESAAWSIRHGWRRLGLRLQRHRARAVGANRCNETNGTKGRKGTRCQNFAMAGHELCWQHRHRDKAAEIGRRALGLVA